MPGWKLPLIVVYLDPTYRYPYNGAYNTSLRLRCFVLLYKKTLENKLLCSLIPFPPLPHSSTHSYWSLINTLHKHLITPSAVASVLPNLMRNLQPSYDLLSLQCWLWLIPSFFLPSSLGFQGASLLVATHFTGQPFSNSFVIFPRVQSSAPLSCNKVKPLPPLVFFIPADGISVTIFLLGS